MAEQVLDRGEMDMLGGLADVPALVGGRLVAPVAEMADTATDDVTGLEGLRKLVLEGSGESGEDGDEEDGAIVAAFNSRGGRS
jgi:hypothetical protein